MTLKCAKIRLSQFGILISFLVITSVIAETYRVTNTLDGGEGSLRWAIDQTNQHVGPDTIVFDISQQDEGFNGTVWIIRPQSIFSGLYDGGTFVDGTSQEINQGDQNPDGPDIIIDGRNITQIHIGFIISSPNNIICGLTITGFSEFGIRLREEEAQYNEIWGNFIGNDGSVTDTLGNGHGIYISRDASYTTIGGEDVSKRNVISGNNGDGIRMTATHHNTVIGNFIGTDRTGTMSVPNGRDGKSSGIYLGYLSRSNDIGGENYNQRNIISGNGRDGIQIATSDSNTIQGNFIGPDITGVVNLGNSQTGIGDGIDIRYGSSWNIIGGNSDYERNIICGAINMGIRIFMDSTHNNIIVGNYIGTDSTGTLDFGNGDFGVYIYEGSWGNTIGGSEDGEGNVIAGSGSYGICISDSGTSSNNILGNHIGVDESGLFSIPNRNHGVFIRSEAKKNQIGPNNRIWHNTGAGIMIGDSSVTQITITQNSITSNIEGGIVLDNEANEDISSPIILSENPVAGTALPNSIVEIFSDTDNQGYYFEGSANSDNNGNWIYYQSYSGPNLTATVTDQDGNTSEFSSHLVVQVMDKVNSESADQFQLEQNYPNPFNPRTIIGFTVRKSCHVLLRIYDIHGHSVATPVNQPMTEGNHKILFDATGLSTGIYIYKITMNTFHIQRKMIFMK